jgi:hypothetical protein
VERLLQAWEFLQGVHESGPSAVFAQLFLLQQEPFGSKPLKMDDYFERANPVFLTSSGSVMDPPLALRTSTILRTKASKYIPRKSQHQLKSIFV